LEKHNILTEAKMQSLKMRCNENTNLPQIYNSLRKKATYNIAIILSREPRRGNGGNLTNVQCKGIGNWHNEYPVYKEYMLMKMKKNEALLF
jgi:hypothetical protein